MRVTSLTTFRRHGGGHVVFAPFDVSISEPGDALTYGISSPRTALVGGNLTDRQIRSAHALGEVR